MWNCVPLAKPLPCLGLFCLYTKQGWALSTQAYHQEMVPVEQQTWMEDGHLSMRTWSAGDHLPLLRIEEFPKLGLESSLVTAPVGREWRRAAIWEPSPGTRQPYTGAVPFAPEKAGVLAWWAITKQVKAALFVPEICSLKTKDRITCSSALVSKIKYLQKVGKWWFACSWSKWKFGEQSGNT